jgi:hypothetical protein
LFLIAFGGKKSGKGKSEAKETNPLIKTKPSKKSKPSTSKNTKNDIIEIPPPQTSRRSRPRRKRKPKVLTEAELKRDEAFWQ